MIDQNESYIEKLLFMELQFCACFDMIEKSGVINVLDNNVQLHHESIVK